MIVYMDRRDISPWVESVDVQQQPDTVYSEWTVVLNGWHNVNLDGSYDIYSSPDGTVTPNQLLIRRGMLAPDRPPEVDTTNGKITLHGYDWFYFACRRTPAQTIVITASNQAPESTIRKINPGAIGATRIYTGVRRLSDAVSLLGGLAGFRTVWIGDNYDMSTAVVDPSKSYWEAIRDITGTQRPLPIVSPENSAIYFVSRLMAGYQLFPAVSLSTVAVQNMTLGPSAYRKIRRVLMRFSR